MKRHPLRSGFTTGTCGAAAAKAAAVCLLTGESVSQVEIMTPKGILAAFSVERVEQEDQKICFRVQKDAGDDPDVTHGAWIYGSVEQVDGEPEESWYASETYPHLYLTGGPGIGIVTKPGLSCPIGKHAINPVPRRMIFEAVEEICQLLDFQNRLLIRIWIPQGVELAANTFNPKLGIVGGISVLGTSGIVEPMSEQAILDTIRLEIHMKAVAGAVPLILTPGNYGERFLIEELGLSLHQAVKCSNFIADAMNMASEEGFRQILFVGHIGKMIKVAGGVRNTHSRYGDRRMEILAGCLEGITGNHKETYRRILSSNTTEEALDILQAAGCRQAVMEKAGKRIQQFLTQWAGQDKQVEAVTFSIKHGILYQSQQAACLIRQAAMDIEHQTEEF